MPKANKESIETLVVSLVEDVKFVHEKLHRVDAVETAVLELTKSVSALVESNKWIQRAVLGLYGLVGSVTISGVAYSVFK